MADPARKRDTGPVDRRLVVMQGDVRMRGSRNAAGGGLRRHTVVGTVDLVRPLRGISVVIKALRPIKIVAVQRQFRRLEILRLANESRVFRARPAGALVAPKDAVPEAAEGELVAAAGVGDDAADEGEEVNEREGEGGNEEDEAVEAVGGAFIPNTTLKG